MIALRRSWSSIGARTQAAFWHTAAAVTGFAVHHPRLMRLLPIVVLALAAFAVGRVAGNLLAGAL